ncbi:MAG: prephenate dehydrogenase/arogenate dehydrogenase family protein, partial [Fidelibacterota bacterium]
MYSVGIIGFGRFGRLLGRILAGDFHVVAYDRSPQDGETGVELTHLDTVLGQQTIFIAIPIREFKSVILDIAPRLRNDVTVLDVCSVKVYPVSVMVEGLPVHVGIIATHPLFGPDSISRSDSLRMMMSATRDVHGKYSFWKAYFESKSISVVQMTPEEHDQLAARTQGVTHFVGRVLKE